MLKKILLVCGILSSLLYVVMTVVVAMQYPGYSSASQTISELSAIGAPTRPLWALLGPVYAVLVIAFGFGVLKSAGPSRALRIVGALILVGFSITSVGWTFAPMHTREVLAAGGGTLEDTMHIALGFATVALTLLTVGFGAAALGKRFRFYSIATIATIIAFGVLTGMDSAGVSANLPTPWIGVWQRIAWGAFLLWVGVFAIALLRLGETTAVSTRTRAA